MSIIRCKMCGGTLEITQGVSVAVCEYCGTQQTLPRLDSEKKLTLFARANRLLQDCEFDKAAGVFESIVAEFPEEAEAYWGLILSKFGIEYVDDPKTGHKIPTCHRSSYESVLDDRDLELVLKYADDTARGVYEAEANAIEELRRGILKVSSQEDPYDIFICYKETSATGGRTLDSVLAQDIYTELTEKGYRVFFARISLEDRLGQEYEPYIFAALNSARVMLAIGTEFEHFNAVWVKNEWSRYLQLIAAGKKKTLIPCYKDMDPYDMPKEFARLQAQDLGKVGAMQDLLRGIEKIIPKKSAEPAKEAVGSTTALVNRAYELLEEGSWDKVDICCEQLLNLDSHNAQAYLCKLMAEKRVKHKEELLKCAKPFDGSVNYQKLMQYADAQLTHELQGYVEQIKDRNEKAAKAAAKRTKRILSIVIPTVVACVAVFFLATKLVIPTVKYNKAEKMFSAGDYTEALRAFRELGDFKDASERMQDIYYVQGYDYLAKGDLSKAITTFGKMYTSERKTSAYYDYADACIAAEKYDEALRVFTTRIDDKVRAAEIQWLQAISLMEEGNIKDAFALVENTPVYASSADHCLRFAGMLLAKARRADAIAIMENFAGFDSAADYYLQFAGTLVNQGHVTDAIAIMEKLNGFDSEETYYSQFAKALNLAGYPLTAARLMNRYDRAYADALMADGDYFAAAAAYQNSGDEASYKQAIEQVRQQIQVGDTVLFGAFEQDNVSAEAEPIEWFVINEDKGKYTLISKYILDARRISSYTTNYPSYSDSDLRAWLNGAFFDTAFTAEEQGMLSRNYSGEDVYLLSKNGVIDYLTSSTLRCTKDTAYALDNRPSSQKNSNGSWWLNTRGSAYGANFKTVNAYGQIDDYGIRSSTVMGVRPCITIDLSSVS